MRTQVLNAIDELVLALLKKDVPLILGWDLEKSVYLVAGINYAKEMEEDCIPFDQDEWLVYELSDGLPGDRSFSVDYDTFDEAQKAFERMCTERGKTEPPAPPPSMLRLCRDA